MAQSPHICCTGTAEGLQGMNLRENSAIKCVLILGSQLTPFVTETFRRSKGRFEGDPKGALSGERYLKKWKQENGSD